ncbi:phytoene desaturase family protein [Guptibacillus algicola]|uniref:phytoene desaturase family protein n=1 Tax=Guptibacillus algicola TaxID=225844 RepID=UPI001CD2B004|nr:phytoene desaturase family protein [Alkalihalobacillus algicola]MCA0988246.1 phytoene desaturase [Alkalihalobacillus algicola]
MSKGKNVIVIGAGPGGLTAAMLLASKGYAVSVYEKQPFIGGRTSSFERNGYTFDRGPTFLNMPHILEEVFEQSGRNVHDYLDLVEVDPMYELKFGDLSFFPTRKREEMVEQIETLFPGNGEGYRRFMEQEKEKFQALMPILQNKHDSLVDYGRWRFLKALPKLTVTESVYERLATYFDDERLRLSFTFQAKYLGMSPWECPGAFTILSYMEHEYGIFHPIGGVNQICESMARVIKEEGGIIHTGTPVKRVLLDGKTVQGVELEDGNVEYADEVIINADFAHAVNHLFPAGKAKRYSPEKMEKKKYSCSAFMLYLGVNKSYDLSHHTVVFSSDYKRNVEEITKQKVLSEDPSIYIQNASVTDKTLAPEGKSSIYILAPVPNNFSLIDWEKHKHEFRRLVLDQIRNKTGFKDLEDHIEVEEMYTPTDWEIDMNVYKGATFNLAHNLPQMMFFRPPNQFKEFDHCWLVGGGTHPGSGLPTIMESARITTNLLHQENRDLERSSS